MDDNPALDALMTEVQRIEATPEDKRSGDDWLLLGFVSWKASQAIDELRQRMTDLEREWEFQAYMDETGIVDREDV